jgi:hypothetical protein
MATKVNKNIGGISQMKLIVIDLPNGKQLLDFGNDSVGQTYLNDANGLYEVATLVLLPPPPNVPTNYPENSDEPDRGEKDRLCGGFTIRHTKSGRLMCEALDGTSHKIIIYGGGGDRSWNGWNDRMPLDEKAFGIATPESRGGGMWTELLIVPVDGAYKTAQQVRYEDDIMEVS